MSELVGKRPVLREAVGAFPGQGLLAFCEVVEGQGLLAFCEVVACEAVEAIQGLEYEELGVHQGQLRRVRLDHRRVRRDRDLCRVRLALFRVGEGRIPLHLCRLSRLSRPCPACPARVPPVLREQLFVQITDFSGFGRQFT